MTQERVGSFLCVASPLFTSQPTRLAALTIKNRLPGMFGDAEHVEAGGLMSHSADVVDPPLGMAYPQRGVMSALSIWS